MKANELMIGDWVRIGELDKYAGCIGKIKSLIYHRDDEAAYFSVFVHGDKTAGMTEVCSDDIEPIPLTPEILEKNGWECFETFHGYVRYRHPEAPFDILQRKEDGGYTIEVANVKGGAAFLFILYVHKLQHALRLCGIEKEIEL